MTFTHDVRCACVHCTVSVTKYRNGVARRWERFDRALCFLVRLVLGWTPDWRTGWKKQ